MTTASPQQIAYIRSLPYWGSWGPDNTDATVFILDGNVGVVGHVADMHDGKPRRVLVCDDPQGFVVHDGANTHFLPENALEDWITDADVVRAALCAKNTRWRDLR